MLSRFRLAPAIRRVLPVVALAALASAARAEPRWWADETKDALPAAERAGKGMVLYFESEKSADCAKLKEETWPKVDAAKAGAAFIWVRLQPDSDAEIFRYYDVFTTPQIVVLNSKHEEKGRIQGFVDADTLLAMLGKIQSAPAPSEPSKRPLLEPAKHLLCEGFDTYKSLDDLAPTGFQPLIKHTMRIEPGAGRYNSAGLYIGSDPKSRVTIQMYPSVCLLIDLSRNFGQIQEPEGRLKLHGWVRPISLPGEWVEIGRIIVQGRSEPAPTAPLTQAAPGPNAMSIKVEGGQTQWIEREAITETIHFKTQTAYLMLWVNKIGQAYVLDDLTVDMDTGQEVAALGRIVPDPSRICAPKLSQGAFRPGKMFEIFDPRHTGRVYRKDLSADTPKEILAIFDELDKNHDGILTEEEGL